MAFEELGLSEDEQREIRHRAVIGHVSGKAIELCGVDAETEEVIRLAAESIAEQKGVSIEEAEMILADRARVLWGERNR